jgi:cobalt-zinc-cadmium efflux system outer membrane protein
MKTLWIRRWLPRRGLGLAAGAVCACLTAGPNWAAPPPAARAAPATAPAGNVLPPRLALGTAVQWALEHNPELAAVRQQHGIAAAGVVIARTYPFNPSWEQRVRAASGPESAGISNAVPIEGLVLLELEVRGQGRYRRQQAGAALSRTDWEIATQEVNLAVRVARAFYTLLYRQEKLRLIQEAIALNEREAERLRLLVDGGQAKFRPDLIVLNTEIYDARSQLGPGRAALETARYELFRALGVVGACFDLDGGLEVVPPQPDCDAVMRAALERRPELHSHQAAVAEAEARFGLEEANRFGNPTLGPAWEQNETRATIFGAQFGLPLPVLNTHRGDIQQRRAEVGRAALELRQTQVAVQQDVQAALVRLATARRSAEVYRGQVLPNVRDSLELLERLFVQADPNVDVLRVLDVRRKLIRAQDGYLDALWELTQAWADLAAAVGDPTLLLAPCPPPPAPAPPAPQARILELQPQAAADLPSLPAIQLQPCSTAPGPAPP